MTVASVAPGDKVFALSAFDNLLPRRAITAPTQGVDFLVVWVCDEDEWCSAVVQGRDPNGVPWPAEDVQLA